MSRKRGTSAFTHQDDASAPVHTTRPDHFDALHYGAQIPENREEIILGPPAFGSPDVRTLGHRMNPGSDTPASAPKLDSKFEKLQASSQVKVVTEEQLNEMSKPEVFELAKSSGYDVTKNMTKDEILNTILESQEDDSEEESDSDDDESESESDDDDDSSPTV